MSSIGTPELESSEHASVSVLSWPLFPCQPTIDPKQDRSEPVFMR
jgi:hypothetical protein